MKKKLQPLNGEYTTLLKGVSDLLESARRASARLVNTIMAVTYWQVGSRIVEHEQAGERRAQYGKELLQRLSVDLTSRFGRGFSVMNLQSMRAFYLQWPIQQTASAISSAASSQSMISLDNQIQQTLSVKFQVPFPLPWSHYVRLLSVQKYDARRFYEQKAIKGGWSIRQLVQLLAA